MERDRKELRDLADMGWHSITVWECEMKPKQREKALESVALTLNKIWLDDHHVVRPYPTFEEELPMAAEKNSI